MIWLIAVVLLVSLVYWYGTRNFGKLEKLGIPVVKPYPFIGSRPRPWTALTHEVDMKHARLYGGVWGEYDGPTPKVFVADKKIAKRIFITDFDHFTDRPMIFDFELGRKFMDMLPGEQWKTVRSAITPALISSARLKGRLVTLKECTEETFERIDQKLKTRHELSIREEVFGPIVLDSMAQFAFGMKVSNVEDKSTPFVKHAMPFSDSPFPENTFAWMLTAFPALGTFLAGTPINEALRYYVNIVKQTIKQRRATGVSRPDLVNVLMEVLDSKLQTKEYQELKITEEIILVQGATMLLASFDTIGTTLSFTAYQLVKNPEVLRRLVEEIDGVGELTYDSVQQLPLLDAVINETLRVSSIISRHFRLCTKDWQHEGLHIPAGTEVWFPVWPFHMDPEAFPDPELFLPDRWMGENGRQLLQQDWLAFGKGPRICMGMRMAQIETRYILARLLKRYRISATKNTKLEFLKGQPFIVAAKPLILRMEKL